ncbi:MAG TPA: hypothetical protein VGJ00_07965 [Rhabdochlamydiaceae bacterium]|jgi:hypothetical protein
MTAAFQSHTIPLSEGHTKVQNISPVAETIEEEAKPPLDPRQSAIRLAGTLLNNKESSIDLTGNEELRVDRDTVFDDSPILFDYEKRDRLDSDEVHAFLGALKARYHLENESGFADFSSSAKFRPLDPGPASSQPPRAQKMEQKNKKPAPKDHNLALAFLHMQKHTHDVKEERINELISQLAEVNEENKDLHDLMSVLTACKEGGKADFSDNPEMKGIIDRLHKLNPKIFANQKTYVWNSSTQIDVTLSALDSEVKMKVSKTNQLLMKIHLGYDERIQFTENARKVLEMLIRHVESIISKFNKN